MEYFIYNLNKKFILTFLCNESNRIGKVVLKTPGVSVRKCKRLPVKNYIRTFVFIRLSSFFESLNQSLV